MKRKIWIAAVITILCTLITAGSAFAYFSYATTPVVNVITTGNANIELREEDQWGDGPQVLLPGGALDKSPTIVNTGSVEVYVRIRMTADSPTAALLKNGKLSLLGVNRVKWEGFPDSFDSVDPSKGITIVASLLTPLAAGKESPPLFTGVALDSSYVEGSTSKLSITLTADAVQTIEGKTADECWQLLQE